ncbi:hypothetical protein GE09DRAFT_1259622, partial [Coniochaeta sp. 2T2.1]
HSPSNTVPPRSTSSSSSFSLLLANLSIRYAPAARPIPIPTPIPTPVATFFSSPLLLSEEPTVTPRLTLTNPSEVKDGLSCFPPDRSGFSRRCLKTSPTVARALEPSCAAARALLGAEVILSVSIWVGGGGIWGLITVRIRFLLYEGLGERGLSLWQPYRS